MHVLVTYTVYTILSLALTVWVGRTLFTNGYIFVIEAFGGNVKTASAVNHLLLVGFYLLNIGFVSLFLSVGRPPESWQGAFEYISVKIGVVLLVLGAFHLLNIVNFARMRRKGMRSNGPAEPMVEAAS